MHANKLKISLEQFPSDPRVDFDNIAIMACEHGRYKLGDENAKVIMAKKLGVSANDYDLQELIQMCHEKELVFSHEPLFMYDHSGLTVATTPFSCRWDSGQIGEVLVFKDDIKREFGVKRFGKLVKEKMAQRAKEIIASEVATYDAYLTGNVLMFTICDEDGEVIDSATGFYGSNIVENGLMAELPEEFREQAKTMSVSYS